MASEGASRERGLSITHCPFFTILHKYISNTYIDNIKIRRMFWNFARNLLHFFVKNASKTRQG